MKVSSMKYLLTIALALCVSTSALANEVAEKLQDASVTIKSESRFGGGGQGSGVLFTRQVGDDTISFVLTAAHVVENQRKTRTAIIDGRSTTIVEFNDVAIVQEFRQDGRRVGEVKLDCKVLRYSDADQGEDLALLQVRKKNFTTVANSVEFWDSDDIPAVGTELCHVGSLLGQFGANSYTTGVLSQIGRVFKLGANGVIFDQVTTTAFPGSSGGGVFEKSTGKYIGMLVRGAGEGFCFIVPHRRLHDWAEREDILWALDRSVEVPDLDALGPIESHTSTEFSAELEPTPAPPQPESECEAEDSIFDFLWR